MTSPKQPVKKSTPVETREVKFPEIDVTLCLGDSAVTAEQARSVLGWRKTTERSEALFTCQEGEFVACDNNTRNRPFDEKTALSYAQDILNRNWADSRNSRPGDPEPMTINGETIIIDRYGEVDSGQHRLVGLVFASQIWHGFGKLGTVWEGRWKDLWPTEPTMEAIMVYGVSGNQRVKRTLDNVRPRTLGDVLYTTGIFGKSTAANRERLCKVLDYSVRHLWLRVWQDINSHSPSRTHSESVDFIQRHPRLAEAVKHITTEDTVPVDRESKPIPGAKRKLSRYVPPGTASGMLYLMGCSRSIYEDYRNADPPNEKALNWENWERALEFWTALAKGGADMKEVRLAFDALVDPETGSEGSAAERQAVLCLAWNRWVERHKIREQDLKLEWDSHSDEDGNVVSRSLKGVYTLGGIDLGDPGDKEDVKDDDEEVDENGEPVGGINGEELTPEQEREARERLEQEATAKRARQKEEIMRRRGKDKPPAAGDSLSQQLASLRNEHPGKLLLFRIPGFHGAFEEDADALNNVLGLEVKPSPSGLRQAKIPNKDLEESLKKLLAAGHKVAICEQVKCETQVSDVSIEEEVAPPPSENGTPPAPTAEETTPKKHSKKPIARKA